MKGLTSRTATESDIEQIVSFNGSIFRPSVGIWTRELLTRGHPTVTANDFSIVEDTSTGEIVSSLCFIKQCWLFEGTAIQVGQVELVGTAESFRGKGLIRTQMGWFQKKVMENQCVLSFVHGIPSLYRSFGYHFGVPLKGGVRLQLQRIPNTQETSTYVIRSNRRTDLKQLGVMYELSNNQLGLRSVRDEGLWKYQEAQSPESEHFYESYVMEHLGKIIGYVRLRWEKKLGLIVIKELYVDRYDALVELLRFAREIGLRHEANSLLLQLPMGDPVMDVITCWEPELVRPFAWQIRIDDWTNFLTVIQPVLERRLSNSLAAKHSGNIIIGVADQQRAIQLVFSKGKIDKIIESFDTHNWDILLTEQILVMLVMGYRSRIELEECFSEIQSRAESRYVIDSLFPKFEAYIHEYY